jgi:hypothetical protein
LFDIYYYEKHTRSKKTNYHAIYVDERLPVSDRFTLIHITDLHVAGRNDRMPEILSEVRDEVEQRKLLAKYNNFNNNLRAVIKYANQKLDKNELVVLVATGDLVDYYHDGFFTWKKGKAKKSTSNFKKLVDIVTNRDRKGEPLKGPIFTVLGNHDYLLYEPPLCIDIELLKMIKVSEKDSYGAFNLTHKEGREYDYWLRGCPGFPPFVKGVPNELRSTTPKIQRRRYIKTHGGWDFDLDGDESYSLGVPRYEHLECYLEMINYDTDFKFEIGPHHLVCLNSGEDVYPDSKWDFAKPDNRMSRSTRDYKNGGPHNRGITNEHLRMVEDVLQTCPPNGLVFCFSHPPALSFYKNRTAGMDVLFENKHKSAPAPPNQITEWYAQNPGWKSRPRRQVADAFRRAGYPQTRTRYFLLRDKRGIHDRYSSMHANVQKLFQLITGKGNASRKLAILFSGHTHKVHEFRIQAQRNSKEVYYFIDDYSGSRNRTPASLPYRASARNRKMWLQNHQPLLVTSGALKKAYPELREVVVEGDNIKSMKMKSLPRLGDILGGMEYFYAATSVKLAKLEGKAITSNRVYNCIRGAKLRNSREREMLNVMDLSRRFLTRFSYKIALRPLLAQMYTNFALWLNSFGVNFGSSARNSMASGGHLRWAMSADLKHIHNELDHRIIDIFDFTHPDQGGNRLLCIWFTQESLKLANLGGYAVQARNSPKPSVHMRWALNTHFATVIEDLKDKYRQQFDRLYSNRNKAEFLDFCSESSARLASWGVGYTSRLKPSLDPANYRSQYASLVKTRAVEGIWKQIEDRLRKISGALVAGGSGY